MPGSGRTGAGSARRAGVGRVLGRPATGTVQQVGVSSVVAGTRLGRRRLYRGPPRPASRASTAAIRTPSASASASATAGLAARPARPTDVINGWLETGSVLSQDTDPRARSSNSAATEEPRAIHLYGLSRTSVYPTSPDGTRPRFSSPSAAISKSRNLVHLLQIALTGNYSYDRDDDPCAARGGRVPVPDPLGGGT